jgi:hypothetical protein
MSAWLSSYVVIVLNLNRNGNVIVLTKNHGTLYSVSFHGYSHSSVICYLFNFFRQNNFLLYFQSFFAKECTAKFIFDSFAQWRQHDFHSIDAIIQIFTEILICNFLF